MTPTPEEVSELVQFMREAAHVVSQYQPERAEDGILLSSAADLIESQQRAYLALSERVGVMEGALQEAEECFALAEPVPIIDPRCRLEVAYLGDRYGYGAMMSTASTLWRASLGDIAGGEFVSGPCRSTVQKALGMIRTALTEGSKP